MRGKLLKPELPPPLSDFVSKQAAGSETGLPVRDLLRWFDAERRSYEVVGRIRSALTELGVYATPDFENVAIDGSIVLRSSQVDQADEVAVAGTTVPDVQSQVTSDRYSGPTYRIGVLIDVAKPLHSMSPDSSITEATTKLITKKISQMPVLTDARTIRGVISWQTIGSAVTVNKNIRFVRECMIPATVIDIETPLLDAITTIIQNDYALIRDTDKKICAIVTNADIAAKLTALTEPFLLIREAETYLRGLVSDCFTLDELRLSMPKSEQERVRSIRDLTFGGYAKLLESNDRWAKLGLGIDKLQFTGLLEEVRRIRNDVLHFSTDEIESERMERLHELVHLMQTFARFRHQPSRDSG